MSTTGYGLWLDTTGEATFDLNATDATDVIVDVPAQKLRIVLFTGPQFPRILENFTAQAGRAILPPYWAFAPWMARDYHQNAGAGIGGCGQEARAWFARQCDPDRLAVDNVL